MPTSRSKEPDAQTQLHTRVKSTRNNTHLNVIQSHTLQTHKSNSEMQWQAAASSGITSARRRIPKSSAISVDSPRARARKAEVNADNWRTRSIMTDLSQSAHTSCKRLRLSNYSIAFSAAAQRPPLLPPSCRPSRTRCPSLMRICFRKHFSVDNSGIENPLC